MNRTKVFLDSNILIRAGKPPGGLVLERLKHLVNAGLVTVLITDLTCREVVKKHAENDYNVIKEVGRPHFRNIVKEVLGTKLPKTTKSKLKTRLVKSYRQSTEAMLNELNCWGLVGDVPDSEIEETTVTDVRAVKLVSFGSTEKRGSILIVGRLQVRAEISYTHPDWDTAMYSDDDILVWINDERVSGETEVGFNVDVSMSVAVDKNNNPKSIEELRFLNGDFQHIEIHRDHYYD